jgi:hypothetical protein
MNAEKKSKANFQKPVPSAKDYESKHAAPKGLPCPKDNFGKKELLKTTVAKVPASKAADLSGSLKATHGSAGATAWELASDSGANPSIRSFVGSKARSGAVGRKRTGPAHE